jgi:hypothetical protein
MNRMQALLSELKRRLVGRIECKACGRGEPDDLLLMTMPSGALICHRCLDQAVDAELPSDVRSGNRCIACSVRSPGSAGQAIGKVWMCATCLATAKSRLAADRRLWLPAT